MKMTKMTAFVLAIIMVVSLISANIFAAPSAVEVADVADEHIFEEHNHDHVHDDECIHEEESAADLMFQGVAGDVIGDGFVIEYVYTQCNVCRQQIVPKGSTTHNLFVDYFTYKIENGKFTATFRFYWEDCNGNGAYTAEKVQSIDFVCDTKKSQLLFVKTVGTTYAYINVVRNATAHKGGNPTCVSPATCTLCGTSYTGSHSYSSEYTQVYVDGEMHHRKLCNVAGCDSYTNDGVCSGSTPTCSEYSYCSTCKNTYGELNASNHTGSVNSNGYYSCCGSSAEPEMTSGMYVIKTPGHLEWFRDYVNSGNKSANAVLNADIDMTGVDWKPIAPTGLYYNTTNYSDKGYEGTFDGNGYVISNLSITANSGTKETYGLFGTLSGTVKRVGVKNVTFNLNEASDIRLGGIVGQMLDGSMVNQCFVLESTLEPENFVAGGIAGCNYAGTINSCYVYNTSVKANRGGYIVGDNYADGNNSDGTDRPGTITYCVTDGNSVANRGSSDTSRVNVPESAFVSGEAAYYLNLGASGWGQADNLPALVNASAVYENICGGEVFYSVVSGNYESHNIEGLVCTHCGHYETPDVVNESNAVAYNLDESYYGYYAIRTTSNMFWLADKLNTGKHAKFEAVLVQDIDLSENEWIPVTKADGASNASVLDGNGYTIRFEQNWAGEEADSSNYGLFANYNYSVIRDLTIEGMIEANTTGSVGAIAGSMYRSTVENVVSYVEVVNKSTGNVGGIAGVFGGGKNAELGHYSLIKNCAVYADVSGNGNVGGIIGHMWSGNQPCEVSGVIYSGTVKGTTIGAIAGNNGNASGNTSYFTNAYFEAPELEAVGKKGNGTIVYSNVERVTSTDLNGGYVSYILGEGWGQNLEESDSLPIPGGLAVYANLYCDGETIIYGNEKMVYEHTDEDRNCVCDECESVIPHEDKDFDGVCDGCDKILSYAVPMGSKEDESNVRYVEIDGVVTEIDEIDNKFFHEPGEENLFIEVTEKNADGEVVKTQYFYINAETAQVTKLSMDSYMHAYNQTSIRTRGTMGIRFKSHILTDSKYEETQFVIEEYGFVIATKDYLNGAELTLDTQKKVVGIGYNKNDKIDVVFEEDDEKHIFTCILKNVPVSQYKTDLVCKTYTKISVNGEVFTIYGEPVEGNVYDTAQALLAQNPDDQNLMKIISDYNDSLTA